jgi:Minichromosome loss protein, Mcl1, middle region
MTPGSKRFQSYGCVVFSIRDNSIRFSKRHQHMAVPSDCTLRWIGFSDEGNPCYYDTAGKIHIIAHNGISYLLADTERNGVSSIASSFCVY